MEIRIYPEFIIVQNSFTPWTWNLIHSVQKRHIQTDFILQDSLGI